MSPSPSPPLNGWKPCTWAVAAGRGAATAAGDPLNVPLNTASNYRMATAHSASIEYSRNDGAPGWEALEQVVAGLERGTSSDEVYCTSFSSGMAAIAAVFALLPIGGTLVLPTDCYGGSAALAEMGAKQGKYKLERLDASDTASWVAQIERNEKEHKEQEPSKTPTLLVWIESISNPLLQIADIAAIGAAARASDRTLFAVDATFVTPLNQRPLTLGADCCVHSATKLIGGHSDLLMGVVSACSADYHKDIRMQRTLHGAIPGALETFLCLRGLRTLHLRLRAAEQNALILAQRLQDHPRITCVRYPGLQPQPTSSSTTHPAIICGTIISFDVQGGASAADIVCATTRIIHHATSLGGVESTMERRQRVQEHMPPSLIRFSVGIEDAEDLWNDLERALEASASAV